MCSKVKINVLYIQYIFSAFKQNCVCVYVVVVLVFSPPISSGYEETLTQLAAILAKHFADPRIVGTGETHKRMSRVYICMCVCTNDGAPFFLP